jgi:hypothetical protein
MRARWQRAPVYRARIERVLARGATPGLPIAGHASVEC